MQAAELLNMCLLTEKGKDRNHTNTLFPPQLHTSTYKALFGPDLQVPAKGKMRRTCITCILWQ